MVKRNYIYKIGFGVILVLSIVALISFIKAIGFKETQPAIIRTHYADSLQVEMLKNEVNELQTRVDSLVKASQSKPKIVYKPIKRKKDSCVIELNIHNVEN